MVITADSKYGSLGYYRKTLKNFVGYGTKLAHPLFGLLDASSNSPVPYSAQAAVEAGKLRVLINNERTYLHDKRCWQNPDASWWSS